MAKDAPDFTNIDAGELPEQREPDTYRVTRQVARSEVRQCLEKMGFDVSRLEVEDED